MQGDHLDFGYDPETGDHFCIPERDRYSGSYVLGVQGVGKSGFLETLIWQDAMKGNALIVIDPHGDLISNVLAALPPHRLSQTYLLDMEDETYPYGANLFSHGKLDTSVAQTQVVDRIMHVFEVLWPDVMEQQYLPSYVRAATITLLTQPGATLLDMQRLLSDDNWRAGLVKNVANPRVREFWRTQYDALTGRDRDNRVKALVNRLNALFMGRDLVCNIIGQRRTTINFRQAIENREIVLIRLPIKTLGQDARLIGTVLLARIHAAIFSFQDIPTEQRPGFSLYADEFQHFATPDFNEMFTEGRKFGVKVTVAHQYRGQLSTFLQESTMTARTKVCFQTVPEDGRAMAHFFPEPEGQIKPEDIDAQVSKTLLTRASDYGPVTERFVDGYLAPLQGYRHGRQVEIANGGLDMRAVLKYGALNVENAPTPLVDDPTPYLDRLLYEVMRSGNPNLFIPWEIPIGFSNSGGGFFAAARGAKEAELNATIMPLKGFPADLLVPTADGDVEWTRQPRTGKEWFWHFMFSLRSLMFQLAHDPIGKVTESSTSEIAKMLSGLPRRAAFVRSGDDAGVIYTHNTPQRVNQAEFAARFTAVRQQTRAKYCHPREDVERGMFGDEGGGNGGQSSPGQPNKPDDLLGGWEEE
jgi:hypothetical protein